MSTTCIIISVVVIALAPVAIGAALYSFIAVVRIAWEMIRDEKDETN
jgi:hypothetical protein